MTPQDEDVFTCLHCGQVQRDEKGLAVLLARYWWSGYCRVCGTKRGHKSPSLPMRLEGPATLLAYYAMMAFVWAAIVFLPGALLVGITALADRRVARRLTPAGVRRASRPASSRAAAGAAPRTRAPGARAST